MSVKKGRPKLWTKPHRPLANKVCGSPSKLKLDMSWQSGRKVELMPIFLSIYQHYYSTVARKKSSQMSDRGFLHLSFPEIYAREVSVETSGNF